MINAINGLSAVLPGAATSAPAATSVTSAGLAGAEGVGFGTMLEQMASEMVGTLKASEHMAAKGVVGTASVQEVVESVMAAEQALQVGIGIRDRIVNAYLELSRMAI
jgi:flagellar hook-basal body complex protein FliE